MDYRAYFFQHHATMISPLWYKPAPELFDTLYNIHIDRLTMDMDTLVYSDGERVTNRALVVSGKILEAVSLIATVAGVPAGPMAGLVASMLFAQGSVAISMLRSLNADTHEEAMEHMKSALFDMVKSMAATVIDEKFGDLSSDLIFDLSERIYDDIFSR